MKIISKTLLASALVAAGTTTVNTAYAVEWALNGELAVELTDSDKSDDLDLDVTTTDLVLTISEKFGEIDVEGYIAYELREDADGNADGLTSDGAGITASGSFGSIFVGDDGTDVFVGDATDVLYNNSEAFFSDPTENVIDYGLPLGDAFSLNIFVDITNSDDDDIEDDEDIDAIGAYGSYSFSGFTFALGYTDLAEDGAYGASGDDDNILDAFLGYEAGPIALGFGFQDQDSADDEIVSAFLTYTAGPVAITPYYEGQGDLEVVALNVSYNFTDNFYIFFETANYSEEAEDLPGDDAKFDNSEIGLVLTF